MPKCTFEPDAAARFQLPFDFILVEMEGVEPSTVCMSWQQYIKIIRFFRSIPGNHIALVGSCQQIQQTCGASADLPNGLGADNGPHPATTGDYRAGK